MRVAPSSTRHAPRVAEPFEEAVQLRFPHLVGLRHRPPRRGEPSERLRFESVALDELVDPLVVELGVLDVAERDVHARKLLGGVLGLDVVDERAVHDVVERAPVGGVEGRRVQERGGIEDARPNAREEARPPTR